MKNNKTVLLVEDDESLVNILKTRLEEAGLEVKAVNNVKDALSLIKENHPGLLLLDIMLPGGMNGFDLLERLKSDGLIKSFPVIVLTNLDTEQKTALEIGASDYIVKANISIDGVVEKVNAYLK